jgi:hypothetical protein
VDAGGGAQDQIGIAMNEGRLGRGQRSVRPLVVYVSDIVPSNTTASSVVIFRHLISLEREGYDICLVIPEIPGTKPQVPSSWITIVLPSRRIYYPPYRRFSFLRMIRWIFFDRIVAAAIGGRNIQCVIGLLVGEYLVNYAEWLSRRLKASLFYFYHDRGERLHFANDPIGARRLRHQNLRLLRSPMLCKVWTVTPELTYPELDKAGKFSVVYPLPCRPESLFHSKWNGRDGGGQVLVHIGAVYSEIMDTFRQILVGLRAVGSRLLIFSSLTANAEALASEFPDVVEFCGFADDMPTLLRQLAEISTAFIIVYPNDINAMPWCMDCFPSKFAQLVHTGLPGIVFAPRQTAIGRWCLAQAWPLYSDYADGKSIERILRRIGNMKEWEHAVSSTRHAASFHFNPDYIERQVNCDVNSVGPVWARDSGD